jgi:menaquinone-dependent protoporphyrinogen oxidase
VVLGGAVRMARLLPDVTKFAKRHAKSLAALPTAYFSVSLTAADATEEAAKTLAGYLQPLRDIQAPIKECAFAGAVIMNRLEPIMRWMLSKSNDGKLTECDIATGCYPRLGREILAVTLARVIR